MPLPENAIVHHTSLYADDLVVLLASWQEDFTCLKQILDLFRGGLWIDN